MKSSHGTRQWCIVPLAAIYALVVCVSPARAGLLQAYSGNTDTENTSASLQFLFDFAVYDRLSGGSAAGDTFGTGYSGFDALSLVDTTARYLYLYEISSALGTLQYFEALQVLGVTSTTQVNLAFTDSNGVVSSTNPFGTNAVNFQTNAPANVGVTSPGLVAQSGLVAGSLSLSGGTFEDNVSVPAGSTSEIIGFTSNDPPELSSAQSTAFFTGGTIPIPVPEPGSLALCIAAAGGGFVLSRARTVRRHG